MKRSIRKAFTLIEIMAATAIMTIIVTTVLILTTQVLDTWTRSSAQLQSFFEGGVVSSIIQEDLESAFIKKNDLIWFTVYYPSDPIGMLSGKDPTDTVPMRPAELMFFSRTSNRPLYTYSSGSKAIIPGNLCAIKYQISLKSPFLDGSTSPKDNERQVNANFGLYRAVIDSKSTMTEFIPGLEAMGSSNEAMSLASFWLSSRCTILDEEGTYKRGTTLSTWSLSPENLVVSNLIDFRITFAVRYPNADWTATSSADIPEYKTAYIPAGVGFSIGKELTLLDAGGVRLIYQMTEKGKVTGGVTEDDLKNASLASAEISMVFISEQGSKLLRAAIKNNSLTEDSFKELVSNAGSKAITKRIEFVAEPHE